MIRLENVTKTFATRNGVRTILRDCTLDIPAGYSLGILGRNGAGKSTLLRLLAGVDLPDNGRILHDCRVSFPVGFTSTFREEVSGQGNVRFVARLYGEDERRVERDVEAFAGLGAYFAMPVRTYSSGMRARLAFGLSLAIEFDVYLIDEVTAVGDADFRERSRAAFSNRMEDADVIMVSHDLSIMQEYCDLGAVLDGGRLRLYDNLRSAIRAYQDLKVSAPVFGERHHSDWSA